MKKIVLLLFVIILSSTIYQISAANEMTWHLIKLEDQTLGKNNVGEEIWGEVRFYTGHSIILESGEEYRFSKNVLIDVENLAQHRKGNVRIVLNLNGKAEFVFFHGIDMPEVLRRFGR